MAAHVGQQAFPVADPVNPMNKMYPFMRPANPGEKLVQAGCKSIKVLGFFQVVGDVATHPPKDLIQILHGLKKENLPLTSLGKEKLVSLEELKYTRRILAMLFLTKH